MDLPLLNAACAGPGGEEPVRVFLIGVPAEVRDAAMSRQWNQLAVLTLIRAEPRTMSLCAGSPQLFWLVVETLESGRMPLAAAAALTLRKRKDVAGELLGVSRGLVGLLDRVRLVEYSLGERDVLLAVGILSTGSFYIMEMRNRWNREPGEAVFQVVRDWLSASRKPTGE